MADRVFTFTSFLDCSYREDLEQLLFHNANQSKVYEAVVAMIERYGEPRIFDRNGRLWVAFTSGVEAQPLFVMERGDRGKACLVGAAVYTREKDVMAVLLLAVGERYSQDGPYADRRLFQTMLGEMRRVARSIKDIFSIQLYLTHPPVVLSVPRGKN